MSYWNWTFCHTWSLWIIHSKYQPRARFCMQLMSFDFNACAFSFSRVSRFARQFEIMCALCMILTIGRVMQRSLHLHLWCCLWCCKCAWQAVCSRLHLVKALPMWCTPLSVSWHAWAHRGLCRKTRVAWLVPRCCTWFLIIFYGYACKAANAWSTANF